MIYLGRIEMTKQNCPYVYDKSSINLIHPEYIVACKSSCILPTNNRCKVVLRLLRLRN